MSDEPDNSTLSDEPDGNTFSERMGRIQQRDEYRIDWEVVREAPALLLSDLCALSLGLHPSFARLMFGMTEMPSPQNMLKQLEMSRDPFEELPAPIGEITKYCGQPVFTDLGKRLDRAHRHLAPLGKLQPAVGESKGLQTPVRVEEFAEWAEGMGWALPAEFPRAGKYPALAEGLRLGGDRWPWGSHETELLKKLAAAADKFWKNYDKAEPDTAKTNAVVSAWLQTQGVAARTADVMATILRADGLATGRRKKS